MSLVQGPGKGEQQKAGTELCRDGAVAAWRGVGSAVTQPLCSCHFSPPGASDEGLSTQEPLGPLVF